MTDLRDLLSRATDTVAFCRERAEGYQAFRQSAITPVALDRAADTIESLLSELDGARERIAELELNASALAESLDEISNMLMGRPDMVRALQPLIGWAEKAVMARAAGALQGHIARARALGEKKL